MNRKQALLDAIKCHVFQTPAAVFIDGPKSNMNSKSKGVKYKFVFTGLSAFHQFDNLVNEVKTWDDVGEVRWQVRNTFSFGSHVKVEVWFKHRATKKQSVSTQKDITVTTSKETLTTSKETLSSTSDILCCDPALVKAMAIGALELMMQSALDDLDMLEENTSLKLREAAREYTKDVLRDIQKAILLEINKTPVEFEVVQKVAKSTVDGRFIPPYP